MNLLTKLKTYCIVVETMPLIQEIYNDDDYDGSDNCDGGENNGHNNDNGMILLMLRKMVRMTMITMMIAVQLSLVVREATVIDNKKND